ncbi:MAG: PEP-CTERM sorting domain-containing protein [Burkholderiales bacterium]|nr:PEP-CTERM sorting domain-containing protein [Phycisphaerae bacterium]
MRMPILGVCCGVAGLILASERADAVASTFPLTSRVTAGLYSSIGSPTMQDPSGFGYLAPPIGPYTAGTAPLGATPPLPLYPTYGSMSGGTDFIPAGGVISSFNDGLPPAMQTIAASHITQSNLLIATNVEDFSVNLPFWHVKQSAAATGYIVNQLNFDTTYNVAAGSSLATSSALLPLTVGGMFGPSAGYAQFDAVMEYSYTPFLTTAGNLGVPVSLGSLTYSFSAATPGLPFLQTVNAVNTLLPLPVTTNAGILEIHGHAWIAGDPFEMTILPEPASISLLGFGALMLIRRRRGR